MKPLFCFAEILMQPRWYHIISVSEEQFHKYHLLNAEIYSHNIFQDKADCG